MQRRLFRSLLIGLEVCFVSVAVRAAWSQQPSGEAASLSSTSLSRLQGSSPSDATEVSVRTWYLLGPYPEQAASQRAGLDFDYLAAGAYPEAKVDVASLTGLCKDSTHCQAFASAGPMINLAKLFPDAAHSVLYSAAVLESAVDGYLGLQYDISFGTKIWLNGQLVDEYRASARHPVSMYVHFAPLHLKKGQNVLLIKTDQGNLGADFEPWALAASILPIQKTQDLALSNLDGFLLANRLLRPGDSLHIPLLDSPMMLDRSKPITISIMKPGKEPLFKKNIGRDDNGIIQIPVRETGYYQIRLETGRHTIDDAFHIGDPVPIYEALLAAQKKVPEKSDEFLQRDAIIKRYEILTSPQYLMESDPNWQRKLMLVIGEAESSIADHSAGPWYSRPGQHLREFVSAVDGAQHNYFLDVPETRSGAMGLVVVVPYAVSKPRAFLESSFISYSAVLAQVGQAAEEAKLAVAIVNAEDSTGESDRDEVEIFEMLKDVASHYSIDPKRVYLYGVSEGGRRALILAEHHPNVFAAIGTWGAELSAGPSITDDPVGFAKQLASTPVLLFKGDLDDEFPTSDTLTFGKTLEALGNQDVTVRIVPNAMHDPLREESVIFPLLARYQNANPSTSINDLAANAVSRVSH